MLGAVDKLKDGVLEVGRKIEPNLRLIVAKEYLRPANERTDGYYWVRMPVILSRSIPHDDVHEGWEPAFWDRACWHTLGLDDRFKDNDLEVGRHIIPKILQLLEECLAIQHRTLDTLEVGLKEMARVKGGRRISKPKSSSGRGINGQRLPK
jgi:hypothetical protein